MEKKRSTHGAIIASILGLNRYTERSQKYTNISGAIHVLRTKYNSFFMKKSVIKIAILILFILPVNSSYSEEKTKFDKFLLFSNEIVKTASIVKNIDDLRVAIAGSATATSYSVDIEKFRKIALDGISEKIRTLNNDYAKLDSDIITYKSNSKMVALLTKHKKSISTRLSKLSAHHTYVTSLSNIGTKLDYTNAIISLTSLGNDIYREQFEFNKSALPVLNALVPIISSYGPKLVSKGIAGPYAAIGTELIEGADKILNVQRELGDTFRERFSNIKDEYFSQYNQLSNIAYSKGEESALKLLNYNIKRRAVLLTDLKTMHKQLDTFYVPFVTDGALPFSGKKDLLKLIDDFIDILETQEAEIQQRQIRFIKHFSELSRKVKSSENYYSNELDNYNDQNSKYIERENLDHLILENSNITQISSDDIVNNDDINSDLTDEDAISIAGDTSTPLPQAAPSNNEDDDFPFLGFVAGKLEGEGSLFTGNLYTGRAGGGDAPLGSRGEARINRNGTNTFYSDNVDPSIRVQINESENADGFRYSDWGEWNGHGLTVANFSGAPAERGFYVIGQFTNSNDIPRSGSANYSGQVRGIAFSGENIGGTVNLNANFSQRNVNARLGLTRENGSRWVNVQTGNLSYERSLSQNFEVNFGGSNSAVFDANGNRIDGAGANVRGMFVGPNAEEIIGDFAIGGVPDDVGGVDGVFRARQDFDTSRPILDEPRDIGIAGDGPSSGGDPILNLPDIGEVPF